MDAFNQPFAAKPWSIQSTSYGRDHQVSLISELFEIPPMKLVRHTIYNLLGLGLPLIVAVFSIPALIKELGDARFGLLTLIWSVVSYFGLFDLGLGRTLTQQLAVVLGEKDYKRVGPLVGTATVIMTVLGVIAGILMAAAAPWGVNLINAVPDKQEAIYAVYAMALAMPAIVLTSGFRGNCQHQPRE